MKKMIQKHLKDDLVAGFIVFLIALPLSIGIALAAGAPASAGILSAIIGGVVGTLITGSHIAITGPAAGLIVIIGGSIVSLSDNGDFLLGFKRTLAATIVAGILQVILGLLKWCKLTFLAPSSVVHGMLAAIGTIIMIKQVPVLLGVKNTATTIVGTVTNIPIMFTQINFPIFMISCSAFIVLITWMYLPKKISNLLPGPLVVVGTGLALSFYFKLESSHNIEWLKNIYHLGPEYLVLVPKSIKELFIFPVFDIIFSTRSFMSIGTIFLVGSLESLLSAYAVDKLDPYKRKTDLDFDIIGKGITNITCGLLGAYPVITEIVRSSANITNGAKTKWSNLFHGLFILFFVAFFPAIINHIPLSSLAAILFLVGFHLTHPKHFIEVYHHGKDQLIYFLTTLIFTLAEDLLVGIAMGIIVKFCHHLFMKDIKLKHFFSPELEYVETADKAILSIKSPLVFLGYLKLEKIIAGMNTNKVIEIQVNGHYIDHTAQEILKDFLSNSN